MVPDSRIPLRKLSLAVKIAKIRPSPVIGHLLRVIQQKKQGIEKAQRNCNFSNPE